MRGDEGGPEGFADEGAGGGEIEGAAEDIFAAGQADGGSGGGVFEGAAERIGVVMFPVADGAEFAGIDADYDRRRGGRFGRGEVSAEADGSGGEGAPGEESASVG